MSSPKLDSEVLALTVASLLVDLGASHAQSKKALGQAGNMLSEAKRNKKSGETFQTAFIRISSWFFSSDLLKEGAALREALATLKNPKS